MSLMRTRNEGIACQTRRGRVDDWLILPRVRDDGRSPTRFKVSGPSNGWDFGRNIGGMSGEREFLFIHFLHTSSNALIIKAFSIHPHTTFNCIYTEFLVDAMSERIILHKAKVFMEIS
jgi:hypothetical protein